MKEIRFYKHCLLVLSLFLGIQPAQGITDNTPPAVVAIVGGSITVLGAIIYALLKGVPNFRYANEAATLAKMRSQYQSSDSIASDLNNTANGEIQSQHPNTPAAELATVDPNGFSAAIMNRADALTSLIYQVDQPSYTSFRQTWQTNLNTAASDGTYVDAASQIVSAVSRTGIGQFDLPSNYASPLDYLMKNNINTPQALTDLINQATANNNALPSTYTPTPADNPGFITGSGRRPFDFDTAYNSAYDKALQQVQSLGGADEATQMLKQTIASYESVTDQIKTLQQSEDLTEEQQAELDAALNEQAGYVAKAAAIRDVYPDVAAEYTGGGA